MSRARQTVTTEGTAGCPLLFVYGTLLSSFNSPVFQRMREYCEPAGSARMPGRLYNIGSYPGAVDPLSDSELVHGEIFHIDNASALFGLLDDYEECLDAYPLPHEYQRVRRDIRLDNDRPSQAWVYLYQRSTVQMERIMGGCYRQFISDRPGDRQLQRNDQRRV